MSVCLTKIVTRIVSVVFVGFSPNLGPKSVFVNSHECISLTEPDPVFWLSVTQIKFWLQSVKRRSSCDCALSSLVQHRPSRQSWNRCALFLASMLFLHYMGISFLFGHIVSCKLWKILATMV